MLCDEETPRSETVHVAVLSVVPFCVSVLSAPPVQVNAVPPSENVTVPVGCVNPAIPVSVAAYVSEVPYTTEADPVVRARVIDGVALVTVSVTAVEGPAAP